MNTNNQNDPSLDKALKQWKVNEPLPPRFQEQVWQRIEKAELPARPPLWQTFVLSLERMFAKPALAFSYVAVLFMLGLGSAYLTAQTRQSRTDNELASRYVHSIDPYQKIASK